MKKVTRVLHISTHNETCGIGKYQDMFVDAMRSDGTVINKFFDVSPNIMKHMSQVDLQATLGRLETELSGYDILHIQYEFSFYFKNEFKLLCELGKQAGKKVIVTVHTSPSFAYKPARLGGLSPRSFVAYARALRWQNIFRSNFIDPLQTVDRVIAHNMVTVADLQSLGIEKDKIKSLTIPVPDLDRSPKSSDIAKNLHKKDDDIIYCTTGFMHKFKGLDAAIKALNFLPANYKLAIIGGVHPEGDNETLYDKLTDLVVERGLIDRVYITGRIETDEQYDALIRECDICVHPYDKTYYSKVTSAALNRAFANHVPAIAYPTASFKELNDEFSVMTLTQSCSYYELAKVIKSADLEDLKNRSVAFAADMSYGKAASGLAGIYHNLLD